MPAALDTPQVQSATDIEALRNFLDDCGGEHIGIIAKIETLAGLRQFDEILGAVRMCAWHLTRS